MNKFGLDSRFVFEPDGKNVNARLLGLDGKLAEHDGKFVEHLDKMNLIKTTQINIKEYQHLVLNGDWKPAFEAAFLVADKIYVPKGEYSCSLVDVPSGKTIYGDGDSTVFKPLSSILFRVLGTVGEEVNISSDVVDFTDTINVISASGFSVNDFILLKSQRDCLNEIDSGEAWTLGYATPGAQGLFFGEFMEIAEIIGNTIKTKATTVYPFYKNNKLSETSPNARNSSTVQKVNFARDVVLKDFKVKKNTSTVIQFNYAYNCVVDNVTHDADGYTDGQIHFIIMYYSLNCEARNCHFKISHAITPTQHYYVNIYKCISSINCGFYRCYAYGASQTIDFTYGTLQFPCMGCYADSCIIENATSSGMTTHGGTFQSRFVNNILRGCEQGILIRTRSSIVSNNILTGSMNPLSSSDCAIGLYEGWAVDCVISNNTIVNHTTGILIIDGPDMGESFKYCGAIITGNTIKNYLWGVRFTKSAQLNFKEMGIRISNNTFYGQNETTAMGIQLGTYCKGVTIKDNTFFGRALWVDWNGSNIKMINNTIRGGSTAIFIRGVNDTPTTGGQVFVEFYMNEFFNVTGTQISMGVGVRRLDSITHKHLHFNDKSTTADVLRNNSLFIDSADNKLKFKDDAGVVRTITIV